MLFFAPVLACVAALPLTNTRILQEPGHDARGERAVDARAHALVAGSPSATALYLSAAGQPLYRLDVYLGTSQGVTAERLEELVSGVRIEDSSWVDPSFVPERHILLFDAGRPRGESYGFFYDVDADLAVSVSAAGENARQEISCSGYWRWWHHYKKSTGGAVNYYLPGDMIAAVVGPDRGQSTDPNLYLYYRTSGGSYVLIDSSKYSSSIDDVSGLNAKCKTLSWKVRVYFKKGGKYSIATHRFYAS